MSIPYAALCEDLVLDPVTPTRDTRSALGGGGTAAIACSLAAATDRLISARAAVPEYM